MRRLGATALRRVFAATRRRGAAASHDVRDAGAAGEITGASREWQFGDEQPLDVVRTVRNAVLRTAADVRDDSRIQFEPKTSRSSRPSVAAAPRSRCWSTCRTRWSCAARGARRRRQRMALHALVTTKYPQDAIEIIGFSDYARVMSPRALIDHDWDRVQGTNLQHALMLARRHIDKHRERRAGDHGDHRW